MILRIKTALIALVLISLSGCATTFYPGGPTPSGFVFTSTKSTAAALAAPVDMNIRPLKSGSASSSSILGLFAFGDATVTAAMKNAGISSLNHVDYANTTLLGGLFINTRIIVYGE
jgi:hypothetical protein